MDVKKTSTDSSDDGSSPRESADNSSTQSKYQHPSYSLLMKNNFNWQVYREYRKRCLKQRERWGSGQSKEMNTLFRFWTFFLRDNFNMSMYKEFKALALEDAERGYRYGLQCLFRFYSYGLEMKFRPNLYRDFQHETIKDYRNGELYGLEKFWAFLKYFKHSSLLLVLPTLKAYLANFKTIDDFRKAAPKTNEVNNKNNWRQKTNYRNLPQTPIAENGRGDDGTRRFYVPPKRMNGYVQNGYVVPPQMYAYSAGYFKPNITWLEPWTPPRDITDMVPMYYVYYAAP